MNRIISPSLLSADFVNIERDIRKLENIGIKRLHLDVMDGHFVPNLTFGPIMIKAIRSITSCHLEVHLMIENPKKSLDQYIEAGADTIILHFETLSNPLNELEYIRNNNINSGIAINPNTDAKVILPLLDYLDYILVMSVHPGKGGQKFIYKTLNKMEFLSSKIVGREILIGVDGGVNLQTINDVFNTDIDIAIIGSGLFNCSNILQRYKDLICA